MADVLNQRTTYAAGRNVVLRLERVRCNKRGCARCPHGPYWYAYWRETGWWRGLHRSRTLSAYVGKTDDQQAVIQAVSKRRARFERELQRDAGKTRTRKKKR